MPLQSQREACRPFDTVSLDQTIVSGRFDPQSGSQSIHTLAVQRIDHYFGCAAEDFGHASAGTDFYRMRKRILLVGWLARIVAVIHHSRYLVYGLMQAAAERDVDFLCATAN